MRYLHLQVTDVARFVVSAHLVVSKCDRNGKMPPSQVDQSAIAEVLAASEKLWGALLPYYLWVSTSHREHPTTLSEGVVEVEAGSHPEEFLLVGYEDGGVISISNTKLSFQTGARAADWWRP